MKIIYWNIRGLANKSSRDTLLNFYRQTSLDMICVAEPTMDATNFPTAFLRSLNMKIFAFNLRDGIPKLWILIKNNFPNPMIVSNSDKEITLDFGTANSSFRIYANVLISARAPLVWVDVFEPCYSALVDYWGFQRYSRCS